MDLTKINHLFKNKKLECVFSLTCDLILFN